MEHSQPEGSLIKGLMSKRSLGYAPHLVHSETMTLLGLGALPCTLRTTMEAPESFVPDWIPVQEASIRFKPE